MIKIFPDTEELNNFAAVKIAEIAGESIRKRGIFTFVLSGGSTPKSLYRMLAGSKFRNEIDWSKTQFYFGDERNVAPEDAESNFRMAKENLFELLEIRGDSIFRWKTELKDAEKIAEDYETVISESLDFPRFDLILLGMGADAHTASLFPFTKALNENKRIAIANYVEKLNTTRLTLTFPAINNARNVMFLVAGKEKAETLAEVLYGENQPEKLPAQSVKPQDGNLYWLVEKQAAAFLK